MNKPVERPSESEYDPYYHRYIKLVPAGDLVSVASQQRTDFTDFLSSVPPSLQEARYWPDKWSVKEVVGHLIDTERVFGHRALCIARNDPNPLPGFDQVAWAEEGNHDQRAFADLVQEWSDSRRAFTSMVESLSTDAAARIGTAYGKAITPRALVHIPVGHVIHHARLLHRDYGFPQPAAPTLVSAG